MALSSYEIGQQPVITAEFRAAPVAPATIGVLTDPTVVMFKVRYPGSAVAVTYTAPNAAIVNVSVGVWALTLPVLTLPGDHEVRAIGTGTINTASPSRFTVPTLNV